MGKNIFMYLSSVPINKHTDPGAWVYTLVIIVCRNIYISLSADYSKLLTELQK